MRTHLILAAAGLAAACPAQGVVSPPHAVNVEGNSSSGVTFTNPTTRTQQVDSNLIGGSLPVLRSLAFRRTNIHSRVNAKARKANVTIVIGYGKATHTNNFANNYKSAGTTIFAKKLVSLPDWSGPTTRPAPFDLVFKFDRPWVYNRTDPLLWDLTVENNTGGGSYYMDWFSAVPTQTKGEKPVVLGKGCTTKNGTFEHSTDSTASSTQIQLNMTGKGGPSSAPVIAILGLKDLKANIGLCTMLHGDLTLVLPFGTTDATGAVSGTLLTLPWANNLAGLPLVSQLVAVDINVKPLPFVLSNGIATSLPYVNGGGATTAFKIKRLWTSSGKGPTGTASTTCAPVEFQ